MHTKQLSLGILQCDSVLEQYQPSFGDYPQMLKELFTLVEPQINFRIYNVQSGQYPENINECDAYITTGSKASVYDKEEWIEQLARYVRTLHDAKKKLIGICFGHQLIAQALGGKTEAAKQGWGVGIHSYQVTKRPSWLTPARTEFNLVVSHQDQVVLLPKEAEVIASNDFCKNASFHIGTHIFTIQAHPEFSKDYSAALMQHRQKILDNDRYLQGINSLDKITHQTEFGQWIINFIRTT